MLSSQPLHIVNLLKLLMKKWKSRQELNGCSQLIAWVYFYGEGFKFGLWHFCSHHEIYQVTWDKVKSVHMPIGSSSQCIIPVSVPEATRTISTPLWVGCLSIAGLPPPLSSPVPFDTPGWREALWDQSVLSNMPKNTTQCSRPGL